MKPTGLLIALATLVPACLTGTDIISAFELTRALKQSDSEGRVFSFQATATLSAEATSTAFPVADDTGAAIIRKERGPMLDLRVTAGDVLVLSGRICRNRPQSPLYANCLSAQRIGQVAAPAVAALLPEKLEGTEYDYRPVHVSGIVRDVLTDEIDPGFHFLIVRCHGAFLPIPLSTRGLFARRGADLIGARIEMTGVCDPTPIGFRLQISKSIYPINESDVFISDKADADDFSMPDIGRLTHLSPKATSEQDRHCAFGRVIAVLHGKAFVLKTPDNRFVSINLAKGDAPRHGQLVDVVGFPESDLYRINLSRAIWRPSERQADMPEEPPVDITAQKLLAGNGGEMQFDPWTYGVNVRIRGTVQTMPTTGNAEQTLTLSCDGFAITINVTSALNTMKDIDIGYGIEVTGVCILESETWRPNLIFPKITRAVIVPRNDSDIRIVSKPSWMTVGRLLPVIGILIALLLFILAWNASLRILAMRRGRELFKSQIAKVSSELRVSERTRLAVELHDSITQNLTGVTLQLDAASSARTEDPIAADAILDVARRTLQSCLDELRRCLWDLRSEALEEPDFNKAIRIALKQVAARADIAVRFNVNRAKLSDATAHAILRIIRELVSNAVRHGKATKIRIAGETQPDRIHFAVTDNGCGFDATAVSGPGEGHFGIAGIRERLKDLHGTVNFTSSPEKGTRAEISILLPQPASAS